MTNPDPMANSSTLNNRDDENTHPYNSATPKPDPMAEDSLDDLFRKLEERIEYNRHDVGEMGMFIRVGYVKSFLNDFKPLVSAYTTNKIIEELEKMKADAKKFGTWTENTAMGIETEADERIAELKALNHRKER